MLYLATWFLFGRGIAFAIRGMYERAQHKVSLEDSGSATGNVRCRAFAVLAQHAT